MENGFDEIIENEYLANYACSSNNVERLHSENKKILKHPLRTEFQRDRDRIIHSKSFRRLEYKTQVFLTQTGDHLRTRLTHSLEVSQIARTIGYQLRLNNDLIEAIALGHDVGHTPFGHVAERTINDLLQKDGLDGFKHNVHGVKIFYNLEKKYDYMGLALTIPVLEGIIKHTKISINVPEYFKCLQIDKNFSVTLEGQVVAVADEIAQITHDLDDYLRYGIISFDDFIEHELFDHIRSFYKNTGDDFDKFINTNMKRDIIIRCLVDFLVTTLIETSKKFIDENLQAFSLDKNYIHWGDLTPCVEDFQNKIRAKLFKNYKIIEMDKRGKEIITTLYNYYKSFPEKISALDTNVDYSNRNNNEKIEMISNYIAGMTDRYAIDKYQEIIKI